MTKQDRATNVINNVCAQGDMNAELAIFDLDGTIIDTDAANNAAYCRALADIGVASVTGLYGRVTSQVIRKAFSLKASEVDAIMTAKVNAYCQELWRTKLGPAANELECILIRPSSFRKIVLLTDSAERRAIETLRHWGLSDCFDEIVCNGGCGDKYMNYFKLNDSDPAACVVWENEEGEVNSAIAAGVKMENIRKVG